MRIEEVCPTRSVTEALISLSVDWEEENSCRGYTRNAADSFAGKRIFAAYEGERMIGYLLGAGAKAAGSSSVIPDGTPFFEVEEIYVTPSERSKGVGRAIWSFAEDAVGDEYGFIMLTTAARDHKAILRFYIDELGMDFWYARLFKKIK